MITSGISRADFAGRAVPIGPGGAVELLASLRPMLNLSVANKLEKNGARLPVALWPLVDALAWPAMLDAVTSPAKSESVLTELEAMERAFVPTVVDAETETGPVVRTEPSLG